MNITDYGFDPAWLPSGYDMKDTARITAVYRDRYEFICESGSGYARLKTGAFYSGENSCPTVGDFVLLNRQEHGDSLILKRFPGKAFLIGWIRPRQAMPDRQLQQILTVFSSCSP